MEASLTDFENAAFTVFVVLVARAIQHFRLNMYMPLSQVDMNMAEAHRRDAVLDSKFFWRKNVCEPGYGEIAEYTVNEIINGFFFESHSFLAPQQLLITRFQVLIRPIAPASLD